MRAEEFLQLVDFKKKQLPKDKCIIAEREILYQCYYTLMEIQGVKTSYLNIKNTLNGVLMRNISRQERQLIENLENCFRYTDKLINEKEELKEEHLLKLNDILFYNISKLGGLYREKNHDVKEKNIGFSVFTGLDVKISMEELFLFLEREREIHPIKKGVLFYVYFVKISPFYNGNIIVARMCLNYFLKKSGYPLIYFNKRETEKIHDFLIQDDIYSIIVIVSEKIIKIIDVIGEYSA